MTEEQHITRWVRLWPDHQMPVGPGDDCAVLHSLPSRQQPVWKTDAIVQDVHFRKSDNPRDIGHKALARVLSDFAAMGARPLSVLVTVGIPPGLNPLFIDDCYRGMAKLATTWNVSLAGGETTRSRELWFSINGLGLVPQGKAVTRSGAKPGHLIFVTGKLGGSFPKRHLTFSPRLNEGIWLGSQGLASSMMDLSDGLGKDLPRLAQLSGVSFHIRASCLPKNAGCTALQAINDGEDYELLFTVPPGKIAALEKKWPFKTKLRCIGHVGKPTQPHFTDGLVFQGYDHFEKKIPKSKTRRPK